MGWEDAPIVQAAPKREAWENAPIVQAAPKREASGIADAIQAGYQGSAPGLAIRGKLPDVQLDPAHSKWYERLAAGATQLAAEFPLMIPGSVAGGAAGSVAGPIGTVVGGGAGAFALPAAIRQSYIEALSKGEITGSPDFLNRAAIVLKQTGKEALIGAATMGAGMAAARTVGAAIAPSIGTTLSVPTATRAIGAASFGAELTTLTVAPALLEGRLPEPQEFMDAAILLVGLKGATTGARKLADIYAKTGKTPTEVLADVLRDPTIKEDLVKPEPAKAAAETTPRPGDQRSLSPETELPRAYQEAARQENARNAVPDPSPEAAQFLDTPRAAVPQLPGEPVLKTHVNYDYLNTTQDVKGAFSRLSELYEVEIRQATRGTVPWEQTYAEARRLYKDVTGEKAPESPLTAADYVKLSADLYARKQLLTSGVERLMSLREAYTQAREAGTATDQMKLQFLAQVDRVAQTLAEVRGAKAEVGRALNILQSFSRDKAYYDEVNRVINDRFNTNGTIVKGGFDSMIDMLGRLETPDQVLRAADKLSRATTMDKVIEAWKAGLVSGPVTQVANVLGNATFMATRPVVDATAAVFSLARSNPDRVAAAEPLARVAGNFMGVVDAAKAAAAVIKTGEAYGSLPDARRNAISGVKGEIIRLPFRGLSAADAFFRVLNERGETYALAVRQAAGEGFNPATREFRERVAEIANDPPAAMQDAIVAAGERFTFNAPLGKTGRAVQDLLNTAPVLKIVVPFVQTPTNVAKEMLRLTPAAPFVKEWRDAVAAGGAARDKAIAELAVGTAVSGTVIMWALSGNISGQGDPDPRKRATQMASGWQPYSIKVDNTWYSYQRLQPVGTLVGMAADAALAWESMTPDEQDKIPKILAIAFANAITNQTFLQGITNLVNAVSDPSRFGPRFAQNLIASVVPGAVGQAAAMMDPYQREVDSILDAVKSRLPGMREELMPKRDPYGEPVAAKERMGGISPITTSTPSTDKVRLEVARLGVGVSKAPDYIELPAGRDPKLGRVELTPQQRDIFADKTGHMAHQILTTVVNSPGWDGLPDMAQRQVVERVFESSRKFGKAAAVPPEQIVREAQRIANELQNRMQPK